MQIKQKHKDINSHLSILLIIGIGISILTIITSSINNLQDIRSRAGESEDAERCVNSPGCCKEIADTGDALKCSWGEGRGYCPLDVCARISGKGQKCGWYWIWHDKADSPNKDIGTNMPNGYGCMIGDSPQTMHPKYGGGPTSLPQPTVTIIPTSAPIPTDTPILLQPSDTPSPTYSQPTLIPNTPIIPVASPTIQINPTVILINPTSIPVNPTSVVMPTLASSPTPQPTPIDKIIKKAMDDIFQKTKKILFEFINTILP